MTNKVDLHLQVPESLLKHWGSTPQEAQEHILENEILDLVSQGKISVQEAATILDCDPEELLTPDEEAGLIEGVKQFERGEYSNWEDVKKHLQA